MNGPMRVLLVTKNEFAHERDGGAQRVAAVVRALEARGCLVEYVAVKPFYASAGLQANKVSIRSLWAALRVLSNSIRTRSLSVSKWYSPRSAAVVDWATRNWKPDVTIIEYSQLVPYACVTSTPRLMDLHNIESVLLSNYAASSGGALRARAAKYEASAMRRVESRLSREMEAVSFVSAIDRSVLDSPQAKAMMIDAPNGVRAECFTTESTRNNTVVFVGHLGWRPNIDAACWLVKEVWPHVRELVPEATLQLIGRYPAQAVRELEAEDIDVIGNVPSTIPYVAAARVATAPLLAAGGTRLKILEALASGTPVVATTLGALGIEDVDRSALVIEDDPFRFARAIVSMWSEGGGSTRSLVEHYRWDRTLMNLCDGVLALGGRETFEGRPE